MPEGGVILLERWAALRSGSQIEDMGLPTIDVGVSTSAGPVRLAIGEDGRPRLLIPVDMVAPSRALPEANGLKLAGNTFSVGGKLTRFLDLEPTGSELFEAFLGLAQEVIRRIGRGQAPADSLEAVICEYRELLRASQLSPISRESALGLFGELLLLELLLERSPQGWEPWHGGSGARHDFRRGNLAVEVKISLRSASQAPTIEISALDQLAPPDNGRLFLALWQAEEDPEGRSPADLARSLLGRVSDAGFVERLAKAGYRADKEADWGFYQFSAVGPTFFRVEGDFPRLTPAQIANHRLPKGVSHLRYRVDLLQAKEYQLGERDSERLLEELAT